MNSSNSYTTRSSLLFSKLLLAAVAFLSPLYAVAATHDVTVSNNFFTPNDLTIEVGDTVRWTNSGGFHDVTADDGSFNSVTSNSFTFSRTFTSVAEILYHCSVHSAAGRNINSNMNGRINVVAATSAPDVSIESIDALDGTYEAGEDINVKASLKNIGNAASGMFNVNFYASSDNSITTGDTLLGTKVINNIAAGASQNIDESIDLPANLAAGDYFIGTIIDIDDSNTSNNTKYDPTPITVSSTSVTVPDAPTLTSVEPGDGKGTLHFTANGNGGSAITGYTASCGAYERTGASSPITVSGLINGNTYSCSVVATNAIGDSPSSNLLSVTPNIPIPGEGCDEAFVELDNDTLVINVSPTGSDDTVNIQCALDTAVETGIPTVRLAASTYYISSLMVENFKGSFEGITKAATTIEVVDGSIDCDVMAGDGFTPSVIKFMNGAPRVQFMTIRAQSPCVSSNRIQTILHFTGESALADNCANDVIFGAVDRVVLDGVDQDNGPLAGVMVTPEGSLLGGCKTTLLGTFKLNRSTVANLYAGIYTSMRASAQVDINFNEFSDNSAAIFLVDTNQNTTITTNVFSGGSTFMGGYFGIAIYTEDASAPNKTRVIIDNNDFDVSSSFGEISTVIAAFQDGRIANISSVITNNRFNLSGNDTWGVFFLDVSNAHVSANRFSGDGDGAVFVSGDTPVSGWTITANTGLSTFSSDFGADILLGSNTSQCIVGPGQGAIIGDLGTGNSLLSSKEPAPTLDQKSEMQSGSTEIGLRDAGEEISQMMKSLVNRFSLSKEVQGNTTQ